MTHNERIRGERKQIIKDDEDHRAYYSDTVLEAYPGSGQKCSICGQSHACERVINTETKNFIPCCANRNCQRTAREKVSLIKTK